MAFEALPREFLDQEVQAESTLPLLNFLLKTRPEQTPASIANVLREVTAGIGKDPPPPTIPDESEQLRKSYLKLMKDGPGEVTGKPKVKSPNYWINAILILQYRSLLLVQELLVYAQGTS